MALSFSAEFDQLIAAATAHIPPNADDDDYSLRGLSEVLSHASRQMCRENNLYADPSRVALSSCHDLLSSSDDAARILMEAHRTKTYRTLFDHSKSIARSPSTLEHSNYAGQLSFFPRLSGNHALLSVRAMPSLPKSRASCTTHVRECKPLPMALTHTRHGSHLPETLHTRLMLLP